VVCSLKNCGILELWNKQSITAPTRERKKMNGKMSTNDTESQRVLREMLLRLQDETCKRIKDLRRDQEQESDSDPADELDSAHTTAEVETHAALIAREEEKLRYLDEALTCLNAGKYGKCLGCGTVILVERLMLIPFASYCVECQKKRNGARLGWGQGSTIAPYDHQWTLPDEMEEAAGRECQSTDPEEHLTVRYGEPVASEPPNHGKHPAAKKPLSRRKR
jgi:DnaK suppressor protein